LQIEEAKRGQRGIAFGGIFAFGRFWLDREKREPADAKGGVVDEETPKR
jgi:hypothetical protein